MKSESDNWNLVVDTIEYEDFKDRLNILRATNINLKDENIGLNKENDNLKEEIRIMKNKFRESKIFLNKNILFPMIPNNYLDKKPFYLNYKYRFNSTYIPNYYTYNSSIVNDFNYYNNFTALKEQYIPISKYLKI